MDPIVRGAVARIDVVQAGRSASRGTGFLVAPDLVLTALHVVADRGAPTLTLYPGQITLTFPDHATDATVVEGHVDPRADWILLRCTTPPQRVRPIPLADGVEDGATWETYGFPDANPRDGMVQTGTVENARGTFEGIAACQLFSRQAAAGSGAPVKGLSGGPVIVDGAIVGLLRSSLMKEGQNVAGTLYGCPTELILERCGDLLPIPDPCRGLPGLPRRPLPPSPFRFLERFAEADAEIFFGRNREIRQMYDHVTSDEGPGLVLLYGQSGAGKSSFLDAGLLPRLEATHLTVYLRRDRQKGLLRTIVDALATTVPAAVGTLSGASTRPAQALRLAWLGSETAAARPLVVVLDQVEEAFTLPSDNSDELSELIDALPALFEAGGARGRLILGFRKEWFAELQKQIEARHVEYGRVFLEALDRHAVIEIVTGLERTRRLRQRYGLEVEDGLPEAMARDLTADRDSPVAPTLQVLLSRLWMEATAASASAPRFTSALYQGLRSQGFLLGDFLDQQLAALAHSAAAAGGSHADVVTSGLVLDLLLYHTSPYVTAEQRTHDEVSAEYGHRAADVAWLIQELKRLYILSDPAGDAHQARTAARLSHDTLAPVVRARFDKSEYPGQRARRIVESRASEWTDGHHGAPLDARDLDLVEHGLAGMRLTRDAENRLLAASREARRQAVRAAARRRTLAFAAAGAMAAAIAVAGWYGLQNRKQLEWRDLLALDARIPTLLRTQPVAGLVAAITAADRSVTLNRGIVLAGVQSNLARALDEAREHYAWRVDQKISALAFSTDGHVAGGTIDGVVHIFRLGGAAEVLAIRAGGSESPIADLAFSRDGKFLAVAIGRQGLSVWSLEGKPLPELPALPDGRATTVAFAPDGHTVVAGFITRDERSALYICDLDQRTATSARIDVRGPVEEIAVARNSRGDLLIATAGGDVRVWNAAGRLLHEPFTADNGSIDTVDLTITPDRTVLIAGGSSDGTLTIWDPVHDDQKVGPFGASKGAVMAVVFGRSGGMVLTGTADGFVRTFNARGEVGMPSFTAAGDEITALAMSPDSQYAAVAGNELGGQTVRVIDMIGTELHFPLVAPNASDAGQPTRINALTFAGSGALLVGGLGRQIARWTIVARPGYAWSDAAMTTIDAEKRDTTAIESDRDGRVLLSADSAGLQFRDPGGRIVATETTDVRISSLAVSPDGRTAVAGDESGGVTIWNVATRKNVRTLKAAHQGIVWATAFDEAGSQFATGGADGAIRFWSPDGTSGARATHERGIEITSLVFHPDGTVFAGTSRGTVERYDSGGQLLWSVVAFRDDLISALAIHPSGGTVFIGGKRGLRMLDVDARALVDIHVHGDDKWMRALAVSPDGRLLAGATDEGAVFLWRAAWHDWLAEACGRLRQHDVFTTLAARSANSSRASDTAGVDPRAAYDACDRLVWRSAQGR